MKKLLFLLMAMTITWATSAQVFVNPEVCLGPVKRMNAANNGPSSGNFADYKALHIPYARTHDANFFVGYGAPHTVDITAVFPDFSRKADDPAAYDFTLTDEYLQRIQEAGTGIFFRLGQRIEHQKKKYGVLPPPDYAKWARICEHIILHYNQGWADGFHMGIEYWEIWNEPDLDLKTWQTNPRCWGGSKEEFFKFYETAAKYLDRKFPELKIGGPASAGNLQWMEEFLAYCQAHRVPMDFFSWHTYGARPQKMADRAVRVRDLLDKFGYGAVESILNEWNYVRGWNDEASYNYEVIASLKGAAFCSSVMSLCQNAPVDMLMYYDLRPYTSWCGAFSQDLRPQKPYYAFYAWNKLAEYGRQVKTEVTDDELYATAVSDGNGQVRLLLTRYTDDNNVVTPKSVSVRLEGYADMAVTAHMTDDALMYSEIPLEIKDGVLRLSLRPCSFVLVELPRSQVR